MTRSIEHRFARLAMIGVAVAALSLAACGRKGPLDLPPGASLANEPQASVPGPMSADPGALPIGGQAKDDNRGIGPDGRPLASKGEKKHIFLDNLLN